MLGLLSAILVYAGSNWLSGNKVILHPHIGTTLFSGYSTCIITLVVVYTLYKRIVEDKIKHKSLEILSHSIAHDVSTPFSLNIMEIQEIRKALKEKDYKEVLKYLDELEQYNTRALQDVEIMLHSALRKDAAISKDFGQYSIINCIKDALNNYYMSEEERKRVFFLDAKNQERDFTFIGSATLLRHVMHNLLKNALNYAGRKAKIEIFIEGKNKLHIRDNGYGMEEKILDRLFEEYVTARGHGIGLNFCKEAMKKMNGDIECYSEKDKGTNFILTFNR